MPFLETPLYSHYHLFLRSFHARPWKSFRLSRPIPPHARFPLWETSRLLSLPLVKSSNAVAIFGIPCPPSSWNKRGTAQSRQKISKSLDKGVLETPSLPPSLPPFPAIFFYRSKLPLRGFEETEEGTLDDVFYIFVVVLNLPRSKFSGWNSVQLQDQPGGDLRD